MAGPGTWPMPRMPRDLPASQTSTPRGRAGPKRSPGEGTPAPRRDCHFPRSRDNCPMRIPLGLALVLGAAATAPAQSPPQDPDQSAADRMLEHVRVLSSDEFEGRAPGTAGEELSVNYLKQEFSKLGLLPGNPDGTYIQDVPMVGILSTMAASLEVGGQMLTPAILNEYSAGSRHVAPAVDVKGSEIVFVGYGVVAPEYGWDDFKGVDVRGKTVIMLVNDPPVRDPNDPTKLDEKMFKGKAVVGHGLPLEHLLVNDPPVRDPNDPTKLDEKMFKGKAMTYYGRWTYKYEEASAKGAAACLVVHETGPAGYPWGLPRRP